MARSIGDHYFKRSCTTPENSEGVRRGGSEAESVEGVYKRFNTIDANGQNTNPMVHLKENGRLPEEWYKNYELTPEAHVARTKYQLRRLYKYSRGNRNYLDKYWGNKTDGSFLDKLDELIQVVEDLGDRVLTLVHGLVPNYNPEYLDWDVVHRDRQSKIRCGLIWREWDHPVAPIVELLWRETSAPISYIMINRIPTFTRTIHPFDAGLSCKPGISIWERPDIVSTPSHVSLYVCGGRPEKNWPVDCVWATATDTDTLIINCCDGVTGAFKNEKLTSAILACIDQPHEVWKRKYGYSPEKFSPDQSLYPVDICRYIVDEIINCSGVRDNVTITINALKPLVPEARLCEKAKVILTWSSQQIVNNIYKLSKTDTALFLGDATAERPCNVALTGEQLAMCGDYNNFLKYILPHDFNNKLCSEEYTVMEKIQKINIYRKLIRYAYQHKTTIKSSFKPNEKFQPTLITILSPTDSVDKVNELLKNHYDEYASIFKMLTTAGGRHKAHNAIKQILEGNIS